jgi:hypothetical protein
MSNTSLPSFNARGEMYAVRKAVAEMRIEKYGHAIMGILRGPDGQEIDRDVHLPGDLARDLWIGDTVEQEDGIYEFQGRFWWCTEDEEEDGGETAVLVNVSRVHCSEFDWCKGHTLDFDGEYDDTVHVGPQEILHHIDPVRFTPNVEQFVDAPELLVEKAVDPVRSEVEALTVRFDIDGIYDKLQLRKIAVGMIEAGNALLERGSRMGDL